MALYFQGTATKNNYQVGQTYSTANGPVVAQKDGSFKNLNTGKVSAGSSGKDVLWSATGSDASAFFNDAGRKDMVASVSKGSNVTVTASPNGKGGYSVVNASVAESPVQPGKASGSLPAKAVPISAPVITAANRGAFKAALGAALPSSIMWDRPPGQWSGKDDPVQDLLFGGYHIMANPKNSNAELAEARYAEIGSEVFGLANLGADFGYNVNKALNGGTYRPYLTWGDVASIGSSGYSDGVTFLKGGGIQSALMSFADNLNAYNGKASAAKAENAWEVKNEMAGFHDAWDARLDYAAIEDFRRRFDRDLDKPRSMLIQGVNADEVGSSDLWTEQPFHGYGIGHNDIEASPLNWAGNVLSDAFALPGNSRPHYSGGW